jgi:hypothetical protein
VQGLFTGLPLTVNVQDFFRPSWWVVISLLCASFRGRTGICTGAGRARRPNSCSLVSHFTIASDGDERLRVAGVELRADSENGYQVESCSTSDESHVSGHVGALIDRDEQSHAETL